jgi:hypothetical protein
MLPNGIDNKTSESIIDILKSKHPDARIPTVSSLPRYTTTSDYVDLDIQKMPSNQLPGIFHEMWDWKGWTPSMH